MIRQKLLTAAASGMMILAAGTTQGKDRASGLSPRIVAPRQADLALSKPYEGFYIDAVQQREELARSIFTQIASRSATAILDCAAGTGFPALDLALMQPGLTVHACDGSPQMLQQLEQRARQLNVDRRSLFPPSDLYNEYAPMHVVWDALGRLHFQYDYVMCRGNSLAYARSWSSDATEVATKKEIYEDLAQIAARVCRGGYLHVDAPKELDLAEAEYGRRSPGAQSVWEQVTTKSGRRKWTVRFTPLLLPPVEYTRYSTCLTIDDLREMLRQLKFEDLDLVDLAGERPSLGVIIARKRA